MNKPIVYLSGGLRSDWQEILISQFGDKFKFIDPRMHKLTNSNEYSTWNRHFIRQCDIFFGYMEKSNPSGFGLAYEIGIASALQKTIILIDEKSQEDDIFKRYFMICYNSTELVFDNLKDGIDILNKFSIR